VKKAMITSNLQILGGSLCDSLAGYPAPFPGFLSLNKERKGTCFPREEEPEHKRRNLGPKSFHISPAVSYLYYSKVSSYTTSSNTGLADARFLIGSKNKERKGLASPEKRSLNTKGGT
jgi:hypothetical protein